MPKYLFNPDKDRRLHKSYSFDNKFLIVKGINELPIQVEKHAGFKKLLEQGVVTKVEETDTIVIESVDQPSKEEPVPETKPKSPARRGRRKKTNPT